MSIVTVEACVNGTITRASARVLNRALGTNLSGTDSVEIAVECARVAGVQVRVVPAAQLKGSDKARHTREVNRARQAQAHRVGRKTVVRVAA